MDISTQNSFKDWLNASAEDSYASCREGDYCDPIDIGFKFGDNGAEVDINITFFFQNNKYYVEWIYIWGNYGVGEFWYNKAPIVSRMETNMAAMRDMIRMIYEFLLVRHTPDPPLIIHWTKQGEYSDKFYPIDTSIGVVLD